MIPQNKNKIVLIFLFWIYGLTVSHTSLFSSAPPYEPKEIISFSEDNNTFRKGKDFALFFAINDYEDNGWPALKHPISEAETLASVLYDKFDFDTTIVRNPSKAEIEAIIRVWQQKKFEEDAQVFIFFSGHGDFDDWYKEGYFIPCDGYVTNRKEQISLRGLGNLVSDIPCNHILLGVDACYSGTIDSLMASRAPIRNKIDDINQRISFVLRQLEYNSRLFITSGRKQQTPDKSKFVVALQNALKEAYNSRDGVCAYEDIKSHLIRVRPRPHAGELPGHDGGSFIFITKPSVFNKTGLSASPYSTKQEIQRGNYFFWEKDYKNAFRLLSKHQNAKIFSTKAMVRLGIMYLRGKGTKRNKVKAETLFRKAAGKDDLDGAYNLGIYYQEIRKNNPKAIYWFKQAAKGGHVLGQLKLGFCYRDGIGVASDIKEAIRWFEKAALKGNALARLALGQLYVDGKGLAKNLFEAFNLFEQAAKQGNAAAQVRVGLMYLEGKGVQTNLFQARKWLSLSSAQNNALAQYSLGLVYENGWGISRDNQRAKRLFQNAAANGLLQAIEALKRF